MGADIVTTVNCSNQHRLPSIKGNHSLYKYRLPLLPSSQENMGTGKEILDKKHTHHSTSNGQRQCTELPFSVLNQNIIPVTRPNRIIHTLISLQVLQEPAGHNISCNFRDLLHS